MMKHVLYIAVGAIATALLVAGLMGLSTLTGVNIPNLLATGFFVVVLLGLLWVFGALILGK